VGIGVRSSIDPSPPFLPEPSFGGDGELGVLQAIVPVTGGGPDQAVADFHVIPDFNRKSSNP
jgi:hypothetical protein